MMMDGEGERSYEKMVMLERVYKALDLMTAFLRPALPFVNSHLTEFYTANNWERMVNKSLREDLETQSISQVEECLRDLVNGDWRNHRSKAYENVTFETAKTIRELCVATAQLQLSELELSVPLAKLRVNGVRIYEEGSCPLDDSLKLDSIASPKKMHEIQLMGDAIYRIAKHPSISVGGTGMDHLVDVGSGKGYLSSYLSLLHRFKILGVDSSNTNTNSCERRSAKMEKVWAQLVRRAVERKLYGTCTKRGKNWKSSKHGRRTTSSADTHHDNEVLDDDGDGDTSSESAAELERNHQHSTHMNGESSSSSVDQSSISCSIKANKERVDKDRDNKLLKTLTQFVTSDFDLGASIKKNFPEYEYNANQHFGLIGLHTCGNLGVASLKLFISNENAKFVCNVPCCYHLLDENHLFYPSRKFFGSKSVERERSVDSKLSNDLVQAILRPTFPISEKLDIHDSSSTRFCLGRNARMMSAYSLPRMIATDKGLELRPSIFYRSLLQILIKRFLGEEEFLNFEDHEYAVGRIGDKCSNFSEYVHMGLRNLQLENKVQPTNSDIEKLEEEYGQEEREKLTKYYLLRSIFAFVVESIILLDRLAFLLEQDNVAEAHIVELFEPSVSPRCHAVIALKR